MPDLPPKRETYRPYTPAFRRIDPRPRQTAYRRGYDHIWQKLRDAKLSECPFCEAVVCVDCGALVDEKANLKCINRNCGRIQDPANLKRCGKPAGEVDHFLPIRVAPHLRLDPSNLRSNCRRHNSQKSHLDKVHHP